MSRRKRRRQQGKSAPSRRWPAWLLRIGLALLVFLLAVMGGGYFWLRSWLHSEDFRLMLSDQVSDALDSQAEFGEFRWDGTTVECRSFQARGESTVTAIDALGLSMDFGLDRLGDRVLSLHDAKIEELTAELDLTVDPEPKTDVAADELTETGEDAETWYAQWVPNDIRLTGMTVARSSMDVRIKAGEIGIEGVRWEINPAEVAGAYEAVARGGRLNFPWPLVPEIRLDEARLRYQDGALFILGSEFRMYESGYATLVGEVSDDRLALHTTLTDVSADEVVPEDWRQRLDGQIEAEVEVFGEDAGPVVSGSLRMLNGVLTGLPVLDALGAYGGNPRFRRLALSDASTNFRWSDGNLLLSDLRLGSEGLIRVEGDLLVGADRALNGRLRLGLTPATLAKIPGAETRVFFPGERGLLWTPVRISGTLDDPEEDLTARLIEAAGWRMIERIPETGEEVFRFTRKAVDPKLLDEIGGDEGVLRRGHEVIESGRRLLEGDGDVLRQAEETIRKGTDVVRDVEGIFKFFGDKPEEPKTGPEPE